MVETQLAAQVARSGFTKDVAVFRVEWKLQLASLHNLCSMVGCGDRSVELYSIKVNSDTLVDVNKFCYLGHMIGSGGGTCWQKVYGTLLYPNCKKKFAEIESTNLQDLCPKCAGVCQQDMDNEGRGLAKTRKNRKVIG